MSLRVRTWADPHGCSDETGEQVHAMRFCVACAGLGSISVRSRPVAGRTVNRVRAPRPRHLPRPERRSESHAAFGELHGLGRREAASRRRVWTSRGLSEKSGQRASHLSGRAAAQAPRGHGDHASPRLVFMDEPTVGADVEARSQITCARCAASPTGAAVSLHLALSPSSRARLRHCDPERGHRRKQHSKSPLATERRVTLEFDRPVPSINGWDADGTLLRHIRDEADPGSRIGEALASPALEGAPDRRRASRRPSLHNAYLQIIRRVTMSRLSKSGPRPA